MIFTTDKGNWITQGLFLELSYTDKRFVCYTLKDHDEVIEVDGEERALPSIKRLYLECSDPTEYTFCTTHLGGYQHWKRLCSNKAIMAYIESWREELEVKLRSEGILAISEHARTDKGYQAAKWLAEKGWEPAKRGAPSKDEKERELKLQTKIEQEVGDDLSRILQ